MSKKGYLKFININNINHRNAYISRKSGYFMKRKLIRQGLGGYTIYLPKKWIDRKGLKEGEEVNIVETESGLVVGSDARGKKKITLNLDSDEKENIKPILTHLYRKGFDTIILSDIDDKLLTRIKKIVKDLLLGFEITEKTEDSVTIKNISEPEAEKYDMMLRRIFLIIQENIDILTKDFDENKFRRWKEIEELRDSLDSYVLFCRRVIIQEKFERDSLLEWELLTFLTHIEHTIYYLYDYAHSNKIKKDEKLNQFVRDLKDYFNLYYDSFYKEDIKSIHKIISSRTKFHSGDIISLLEKSSKSNSVILSYLREIYRLIQIGTSPILSKLVEKEIKI